MESTQKLKVEAHLIFWILEDELTMSRTNDTETLSRIRRVIVVSFIVTLCFSLIVVYLITINTKPHADLNSKVDATVINGLLTGFAIIFGFISIEIREVKAPLPDKLLLTFPLIVSFMFVVFKYSGDVFVIGYPSYWSLVILLDGILFNILYSILISYAKDGYESLEKSSKI